jgi:hypothetical protein
LKWNFDEFADMHIEKFDCPLLFQPAEEAKYNWRTIHNWAFRFFLPTGRRAFSIFGLKKEKK